MKPIHLNIPISKIDEEQRTAWGYATMEELDAHNEIIGYDASKSAFSNWIGNIREMHNPDRAVGKAIEIKYDDAAKGVWLGAKLSESADGENAWIKVKEGVLAGFSIGGRMEDFEMVKMQVDGEDSEVLKITKYTLGEVSLVDNPACPSAILQVVKSVNGQLNHVEELRKGNGRPIHWWERKFKFADDQRRLVIKSDDSSYNDSSMKSKPFKKDIWDASYLACLASELAYYIGAEKFEGDDASQLQPLMDALASLKTAIVNEVEEDDEWPAPIGAAMEMSMKTLNISKNDLEDLMEKKNVTKHVTGETPRNADGKEIDPATGKVIDEATETPETPATPEKPAKVEEPETPATPAEGETAEPEKSAKATDLSKAKAGAADFQKSVLDGLSELTTLVKSQAERIDALESKPLAPKGKAGFVVEKSDSEKGGAMNETQKELDEAFARADVLAKDATAGTPTERAELAIKIRKLQRAMDPASVAKVAAVKATFEGFTK